MCYRCGNVELRLYLVQLFGRNGVMFGRYVVLFGRSFVVYGRYVTISMWDVCKRNITISKRRISVWCKSVSLSVRVGFKLAQHRKNILIVGQDYIPDILAIHIDSYITRIEDIETFLIQHLEINDKVCLSSYLNIYWQVDLVYLFSTYGKMM